ncbi:rhodanese-like domain-containing protein [Myceligenerans crystallogenes]|uniref:Rhodanese domain-containing protein n=1 Tax=Myceligenerans crystallogenes TaxID=316335 RepID=A0ABN2N3K8_9MICO
MRQHVLIDAAELAADLQVAPGSADPAQAAPGSADPAQVAAGSADPAQAAPESADPAQAAAGSADPAEGAPVLLDVRWALGMTDGAAQYQAGHIPGAVYVDLETELAAAASPAAGRHPLPSAAAFQEAARRWGIREGSRVVVYDGVGGTSAARAWWLLRYFGADDVRVLDGGLAAWTGAGLALETGEVTAEPGDVVVRPGGMPVLDADDAAALAAGDGVLLDARAAERYRGEVEPVDPQAGHIPGAVSAPTTGNLDETGRFLDDARLRERFAELGIGRAPTAAPETRETTPAGAPETAPDATPETTPGAAPAGAPETAPEATPAAAPGTAPAGAPETAPEATPAAPETAPEASSPRTGSAAESPGNQAGTPAVGVYCGSGVTASHEVAALAAIGIEAALYPGSWSQWSNDPTRETATAP